MGLFADDKHQDERLDALEAHVRDLTESTHQIQLDLASGRIAIIQLQAKIDEKISPEDVDPTLIELNDSLAEARKRSQEISAAAKESWATLQSGAREAFEKLRSSVEKASLRLEQA